VSENERGWPSSGNDCMCVRKRFPWGGGAKAEIYRPRGEVTCLGNCGGIAVEARMRLRAGARVVRVLLDRG